MKDEKDRKRGGEGRGVEDPKPNLSKAPQAHVMLLISLITTYNRPQSPGLIAAIIQGSMNRHMLVLQRQADVDYMYVLQRALPLALPAAGN